MKYAFIKELMTYAKQINSEKTTGGTRKRKRKRVRTKRHRKN